MILVRGAAEAVAHEAEETGGNAAPEEAAVAGTTKASVNPQRNVPVTISPLEDATMGTTHSLELPTVMVEL